EVRRDPGGAAPRPPVSATASATATATASASAPQPPPNPACAGRRWLSGVDLSPDGKRLAASCDSEDCAEEPADTALDVWDPAAGRHLQPLTAPNASVRAFWEGPSLLAAVSRPGTGGKEFTVWDASSLKQLSTAEFYCAGAGFDPAHKRMLLTGCDGGVATYD